MSILFRPLRAEDEPYVWRALQLAAHEDSLEAVRSQPALAIYAAGWGREGDGGVLALCRGAFVGAAWVRLWRGEPRGFGFVDDETPELGVGVEPEHRGRGVGGELLRRALEKASREFAAVSLNVRAGSRAVGLYERFEFEQVAGSEIMNRTGGTSFNMLRRLR